MKQSIFEQLVRELVARGCTMSPAPVAIVSPNDTMRIDYEGLATDDIVDLFEQLVTRRQKIWGSVAVVGEEQARAAYEDVECVIAAVKRVIREALE